MRETREKKDSMQTGPIQPVAALCITIPATPVRSHILAAQQELKLRTPEN
jgi:hypothetical protein